jgi:hypothetical protein
VFRITGHGEYASWLPLNARPNQGGDDNRAFVQTVQLFEIAPDAIQESQVLASKEYPAKGALDETPMPGIMFPYHSEIFLVNLDAGILDGRPSYGGSKI